MVMLKDTNVPIGMCGVLKRDTLDAPDIGYALLPEYEGQGYGTEIAGATLQYAFKTLGLKRILAITLADNERSVKLLNKIGFRFKEIIEIESDDEQLMLFEALA
jgi:RimJ/RimL family protein N-acetyltransferase